MRTTYWFAALVALSFLAGCASEPSYKDAKSDGAFYDLNLDAALAKAKAENKVVMVDFYTDWCGPCKMLDQTTWQAPDVMAWLLGKTVAVKLDAEKEIQASKRYNIRSYPQMVFLKPDGSVIGRIVGYRPAEDFLREAQSILDGKPVN